MIIKHVRHIFLFFSLLFFSFLFFPFLFFSFLSFSFLFFFLFFSFLSFPFLFFPFLSFPFLFISFFLLLSIHEVRKALWAFFRIVLFGCCFCTGTSRNWLFSCWALHNNDENNNNINVNININNICTRCERKSIDRSDVE